MELFELLRFPYVATITVIVDVSCEDTFSPTICDLLRHVVVHESTSNIDNCIGITDPLSPLPAT